MNETISRHASDARCRDVLAGMVDRMVRALAPCRGATAVVEPDEEDRREQQQGDDPTQYLMVHGC